jgi:hypothetical protein
VFSRLSTSTSGPPAKDKKVMPINWYDAKTSVCAVVIHSKIVRKIRCALSTVGNFQKPETCSRYPYTI